MPSKKSSRREKTPQENLRLSIIQTFTGRYNNVKELARAYRVTPETAEKWLDRISNKQEPVENASRASRYLERREEAKNFFEGDREAGLVYTAGGTETSDYIIHDYEMKPGSYIPSNEVTDNARGYQIIIKGRMKGKEKYMTSGLWGELSEALEDISGIMGDYPGFEGSVAVVRVIAPFEA
jgi:hypothetical protein